MITERDRVVRHLVKEYFGKKRSLDEFSQALKAYDELRVIPDDYSFNPNEPDLSHCIIALVGSSVFLSVVICWLLMG